MSEIFDKAKAAGRETFENNNKRKRDAAFRAQEQSQIGEENKQKRLAIKEKAVSLVKELQQRLKPTLLELEKKNFSITEVINYTLIAKSRFDSIGEDPLYRGDLKSEQKLEFDMFVTHYSYEEVLGLQIHLKITIGAKLIDKALKRKSDKSHYFYIDFIPLINENWSIGVPSMKYTARTEGKNNENLQFSMVEAVQIWENELLKFLTLVETSKFELGKNKK